MKIIECTKRIKKILYNIKRKNNEDNISEYAAEAAYFTIISFIPFLFFFIFLIKLTSIEKENVYFLFRNIIPDNLQDTIFNIIEETYSKSLKFLSLSSIFIFWSAGKGFFSLSKGLKKIYRVDIKSNFFLRVLGSIYTLILIFCMIILLFIMILGKNLYIFFMNKYPKIFKYIMLIYKLRTFWIILLLTIFFYFLYKTVPNEKSNNFSYFKGAVFSAIMWQISIYGISVYVNFKKGFTDLYGSFSVVILILFWIYISMYIILIGAKINTIKRNENH